MYRSLLGPGLVALVAIVGGCSSEPTSAHTVPVGTSAQELSVDEVMVRAQQWVDLAVPYCGGVRGGTDYICGGTCSRPSEPWNNYRTDCSGFVSWCWEIPDDPSTATYINDRSGPNGWTSIPIDSLQTGDAIVCDGHIKLFNRFVGTNQAEIYEEYDCGKVARKTTQTFTRSSSTHLYFSGDSRLYHPIHRNALDAAIAFPARVRSSAHDINGDGDADVCARSSTGVVCQRSNGTAFPDAVQGPPWSDAEGWSPEEYSSTVQFGDINGDGKADACARGFAGIECYVSDGKSFPTKIVGPAWSDPSGWSMPQYYRTIQLADVNGDGKADLCARDSQGILCAPSNGTGFDAPIRGPAWSDANGWGDAKYYATIQMADVNGDGKADVCTRDSQGISCAMSNGQGFDAAIRGPAWSDANGWDAPQYGATIHFVDISGDGKADVCGRAVDGVLCALSQGTSFAAAVNGPAWSDAAGWSKPEYYSTLQFADIDADGMLDLCARDSQGVLCAPSTGNGFGAPIRGPAWSDANGWNAPQYYETIGMADIDGDGKADVCGRANTGILCAPSTGAGFGAAFDGPAWSDASGWSGTSYFSTVRYLGAAIKKAGSPGGGGSSGGPLPAGGGASSGGTGGVGPGAGSDPVAGDGTIGPARSGGCVMGARTTFGGEAFALFGLAVVALRRRARR